MKIYEENKKYAQKLFCKISPKGGISLIVLVITIIVVIILVAAIIISLQNNNPMIEANKARITSDVANMQAIFTNTVGKIMAEKEEVIGIVANRLNEPTSKGKSVVGETTYTINKEVVGKIIFDYKSNKGVDYYTGKKLPVYNKETTWYVDEDGILRLQIGDETYGEGTGEEKLNESIKISANVETSSDYTKATISVVIEYEGEIERVRINGEIIEVVKNEEGKYVGRIEVSENGSYKVEVEEKNGTKNKELLKVEEITEDMEIWNREDMESFRDRVNSGRTYEGRTVRVMQDIDLGGDSNNWVPITDFLGTFEGNKHIISNLYIDSNKYVNLGLFSTIGSGSSIQNTILENVYINNSYQSPNIHTSTGGFVAVANGIINNCGVNSGTISSTNTAISNGRWYYIYVGGIVGQIYTNNIINNCYNKANVQGTRQKLGYNSVAVGGIIGDLTGDSEIKNCYNTGQITGNGGHAMVGGIIGQWTGISKVYNLYNTGTVYGSGSSEQFICGIVGRVGNTSIVYNNNVVNSYNLTTVGSSFVYYNGKGYVWSKVGNVDESSLKSYASILGNNFKEDITNKNNGYPILSWQ